MKTWHYLLLGTAIIVASGLSGLLTYASLDNRMESEFDRVSGELEQLRRAQAVSTVPPLQTDLNVDFEELAKEVAAELAGEPAEQGIADDSDATTSYLPNVQPTATSMPTVDICYRSISIQEVLLQKHSTQFCSAIQVRELFRLRELAVSLDDRARLQRSDFSNMPNLVALDLDNVPLATMTPDLLQDLRALEWLDIEINMDRGHFISEEMFAGLPESLLRLRLYFRFDSTNDSDGWQMELPSNLFSAVTALEYLELGFDGYGQTCVSLNDDSLAGLTALRELRIEGSRVGTIGRAAFSDLTSLEYLTINERPCDWDEDTGQYAELDDPHEIYLPDVDTLLRIQDCCAGSYQYEVKGVTTP